MTDIYSGLTVNFSVNVELVADQNIYILHGLGADESDLQVAAQLLPAAGKVGALAIRAPEPEEHQIACSRAMMGLSPHEMH